MTRRENQRVHSRLSMAVVAMLTVFARSLLMHTQKTVLDLFAIIFIHVHAPRCLTLSLVYEYEWRTWKAKKGEPEEVLVLAEGGNTVQNEEETM